MLKRKIIVSILLLLMVFALASCGNGGEPSTQPSIPGSTPGGETMTQASENIIHVYLIAGQSNAVGYGQDNVGSIANSDPRFLNGFENVLYYGSQERWNGAYPNSIFKPVKLGMGVASDRSGAEIGIAAALADNGRMNAIIKCAQGATHLYPDSQYDVSLNYGTWTSPTYIEKNRVDLSKNPMIGYMYERFADTVANGLRLLIEDGYTPVIEGVWWMQGEAEMFTLEMASAYRELFETLILDMRTMLSEATGYDCSNVPFVCGLPKWNTKNSPLPTYQGMVRNAMTTVAGEMNNVACIDCMPLNQHDDWHFDAAGQKYLGEHFVAALQELSREHAVFAERLSIGSGLTALPEEKGIGFRADLTAYNAGDGYEYGFVTVPTAALMESDILGRYIETLDALGIAYQKIPAQVTVEPVDESYSDIYFTGKLTGISYEDLNTAYTVIAYAKNAYGDYLYSSGHVSASLAGLASRALYHTAGDTQALQTLVNAGLNALSGRPEAEADLAPDFVLAVPESLRLNYSESGTQHHLTVQKKPNADYYVRYTSDDPAVVSVDENGLMTAHQMGSAVITVECAGKSATTQVTVGYTSSNGVTLDGEISQGEYEGQVISANNGTLFAEISGMTKNNNLYLAFTLTHGPWSPLAGNWWENDNIEFKLNNGSSYTVIFHEGVPAYSNNITSGVSKTVEVDGKLVTTVELCVENVADACQLKIGMNGANFGWLGAIWNDYYNTAFVTGDGILIGQPIDLGNGLVLDGIFDEAVYKESVQTNVIRANANGAEVGIMGTLTDEGVVLGVTVDHAKAPGIPTGGNGDWYTYLNIEFHFGDDANTQFIITAQNAASLGEMFAYCRSVQAGSGYTTTFEIFIPYEAIGGSGHGEGIRWTARGWFETGWCDLLNTSWNATHIVTSEGLSAIAK